MNIYEPGTELDFCLLIPCYNNIDGLKKSLQSIHYPFDKHMIVIVDDGSGQPLTTTSINFQELQSELHIIRHPINKGITYALNTGLKWIIENTNTKYIARLDCGDICDPARFFKQVGFLNTHPETGLLGSWCFFQQKESLKFYKYITPLEHEAIWKAMHIRNVFIHPTAIFRMELLGGTGLYPYNYPYAEDYALFWLMLKKTRVAILNEFLVTCSVDAKGISAANRKIQLQSCQQIISAFGENGWLKFLGLLHTKVRQWLPQKLILQLKLLARSSR